MDEVSAEENLDGGRGGGWEEYSRSKKSTRVVGHERVRRVWGAQGGDGKMTVPLPQLLGYLPEGGLNKHLFTSNRPPTMAKETIPPSSPWREWGWGGGDQ